MKKILTILVIVILAVLFVKATEISWEKSDGVGSISTKTEFTITTEDCKEGAEKICKFIRSVWEKGKAIIDTPDEQNVSKNN